MVSCRVPPQNTGQLPALPAPLLRLCIYQQNSRIKTKDYLLDLTKTNYILCLTTTETSEPAVNVRRTSRGYAPLFGIHER